jgi:Asp-tRNA(Asn)/Glu-tRNA(Gln) amidotransferase A subunit family amidase
MMQVLSQPDARDSMSLPWQDIAWASLIKDTERLRGLRIGLLLDAGCGLPAEPEVRAAVQQAARLFEAGRRHRRAHAALHDAGHARRHGPLLAHALARRHECPAPAAQGQGAALHPAWADSAAGA